MRFMGVVKEDMADVEVTQRIQKIGTTGDGKSAVAIPGVKSRKKKKKKKEDHLSMIIGQP